MHTRRYQRFKIVILNFLLVSLCLLPGAVFAEAALVSEKSLVDIGRRIYLEGKMADGQPVKAIVMNDIEVSGEQFFCANCHRRSGLGGQEGTEYVLPTNGRSLLTPRVDVYMSRPAYDFDSFEIVMSLGVTPADKSLNPIMPKYNLPDLEMRGLYAYLEQLSNEYSPGLTPEELHFATVVSSGIDPRAKAEMLGVINAFFSNKNARSRHEIKRSEKGPYYHDYRNQAYRIWTHHVWELSGPASSWPVQLEEYYSRQPVFALFSGMVDGDWAPVHRFCEQNKIPAILPNTDRPVVEAPTGFYTLYFSKGMTLEAQVLGEFISREAKFSAVLQIARAAGKGGVAARALEKRLQAQGVKSEFMSFPRRGGTADAFLLSIEKSKPDAIVLWLDGTALSDPAIKSIAELGVPIYLSSTLLNDQISDIPEPFKSTGRVVSPYVLPEQHHERFRLVSAWLKHNKLPLTDHRIQGQTYYSCMILNAAFKHIKKYFYRDFLLDTLDHGDRMSSYSGNYPRLSYGPNQRFLAKGAYVIELASREARWIVPDRF